MKKIYTGIGSRETPPFHLTAAKNLAMQLAQSGFLLRSGHAHGADMAFENGAIAANGAKQIYIPWFGFNNAPANHPDYIRHMPSEETAKLAAKYHPGWKNLTDGAKMLMMRNVYQVLGTDLNSPTSFVICYTPSGKSGGGTGQAIRIAKDYHIPVFDIALPEHQVAVIEFINNTPWE